MAYARAARCSVLTSVYWVQFWWDGDGANSEAMPEVSPLSAYARAMPCPVPTSRMVLSAYARAMECPVLTWRIAEHQWGIASPKDTQVNTPHSCYGMPGTDAAIAVLDEARATRSPCSVPGYALATRSPVDGRRFAFDLDDGDVGLFRYGTSRAISYASPTESPRRVVLANKLATAVPCGVSVNNTCQVPAFARPRR
eukprot:1932913-Rhodomonas_salina.3